MKKILLIKIADLGSQILPVVDGLIHPSGRDPWIDVYLWLGIIQTVSCLFNRIFLKRTFRSKLRIVYELLLLTFYVSLFSEIIGREEINSGNGSPLSSPFWLFCTFMAIGYGAISCHEIWKIKQLARTGEKQNN